MDQWTHGNLFLFILLCPHFCELHLNQTYELISALSTYFFSQCVIFQLLQLDHLDSHLLRNWKITQLQIFLFRTNVLSAAVHPGLLNTTLSCPWNRPLYVISCGHVSDGQYLRQVFSELHPSDARWLLFMDNTSVSAEDLLRDVNIPFDCEFLVAVESQGAVELKEVYRIHRTLPLVSSHWGSWNSEEGLRGPTLGLLQRRNNLRGIDFITAGMHLYADIGTVISTLVGDNKHFQNIPLDYLGKEDVAGNVEATGYPAELWSELSNRLNFSLKVRRPTDNMYGSQLPNGSWNGIIGMVLDGRAHASHSMLSITTARSNIFDFTDSVFVMWTDVFIRSRIDSDNSWGIYLAPFNVSLWLSVAGCVLITTFFMGLMHHLQPEKDICSFQEAFFAVAGGFCSQGFAVFPQRSSLRLAAWVSLFTGFVVLGSYGARITSSLAVKIPTLPFRDLEGLLRDDSYGFGVNNKTGFVQMFKSSPGVTKDIFNRKLFPNIHNLPTSHEDGFRRVCSRKYAYFCARVIAASRTTSCDLNVLPEASSWAHTAFLLPRRSPYRRIINYTLKRMMAAGIHRKLQLQWLAFPDGKEPHKLKSVQLSDVRAPLFICAVGALMSVCVLLVEIIRRVKK